MDRTEDCIDDPVRVNKPIGVAQRSRPVTAPLRGHRFGEEARIGNPCAGKLYLARQERQHAHTKSYQAGFHHRLAIAGGQLHIANLQGQETRFVERDAGWPHCNADINAGHSLDGLLGGLSQPLRAYATGADGINSTDRQHDQHTDAEENTRQKAGTAAKPGAPKRWYGIGRRQGAEICNLVAPEPDLLVPREFLIHLVFRLQPSLADDSTPTLERFRPERKRGNAPTLYFTQLPRRTYAGIAL